jgi:hypothetical protein
MPKWGDRRSKSGETLPRLVAGVNGITYSEAVVAEGAVVFAKAWSLALRASCRSGRAASSERAEPQDQNPDFVRT